MKPLFKLLTELSSRRWVSQFSGKLAKSALSKRWIRRFAKIYGIHVEEAEKPIEAYESLNDFFTRRLKPGSRPLDPSPDAMLSPVDAVITACGTIQEGELLSIKGQNYTIEELLNHSPRMINYEHGHFFVLYLSPKDYHRIHSPVSGEILEKDRIRGKVYPVHDFSMQHMKQVLSRNERLVTYIQHEFGEVAVVKVGALNVASIQYVPSLPHQIERGAELAYFEFGSTVVLLTESGIFNPNLSLKPGDKVRVGQSLGHFTAKHEKSSHRGSPKKTEDRDSIE
ncbi:archaetidylserine decarboxylase [Marinicrinis lubricantis]|uniref:Phosphatidylserine decarboxylase proenzyme n=1 Tax=Marinicrinis lubricantis TaxID=2086470 RepID=A0ABW1IVE2_9BACL